ncbi:MAG TPA: alpha/beta hydrolase-fold protein [Labilithrix sp.]|nr:alpha/beta hydrolase-fold protein [Labilithrix sp.]
MLLVPVLVAAAACTEDGSPNQSSSGSSEDGTLPPPGTGVGTSTSSSSSSSSSSGGAVDGGFTGDASHGSDSGPPLTPAAATIRVHYPAGAHKIGVRGPTAPLAADKTTPLTAGANDTWELALGVIAQIVEYKPMLDEMPAKGPNYVVKPGQTVDIYPYFKSTKGEVVMKWENYKSKVLPSTRNIRVYTPPSYKENTVARYPVLYVHDGQTTFKASGSPNQIIDGCLEADIAMDQGVDSGKIAEAIVVGVDNGSGVTDLTGQQRSAELTPTANAQLPSSGKGPQYAQMMVDEIKPMIDKEYRTRTARESTITLGSSLGGLTAAYLAFSRGDVFGVYGSQSGSYWWDNQVIVGQGKAAIAGANKPLRVYIDYGKNEVNDPDYTNQLVVPTDAMVKVLRDGGYVDNQTLVFNVAPVPAAGSGHNSRTWGPRLPTALPFLIGPGR